MNLPSAEGLHDNTRCEQCGASSDHPDAVDYTPRA
jgi:hypothetical protein